MQSQDHKDLITEIADMSDLQLEAAVIEMFDRPVPWLRVKVIVEEIWKRWRRVKAYHDDGESSLRHYESEMKEYDERPYESEQEGL